MRVEAKDEVFSELWDRVSRLRSAEVESDRTTARNWRLGEERKMAAVERGVCQVDRQNGSTSLKGLLLESDGIDMTVVAETS